MVNKPLIRPYFLGGYVRGVGLCCPATYVLSQRRWVSALFGHHRVQWDHGLFLWRLRSGCGTLPSPRDGRWRYEEDLPTNNQKRGDKWWPVLLLPHGSGDPSTALCRDEDWVYVVICFYQIMEKAMTARCVSFKNSWDKRHAKNWFSTSLLMLIIETWE